MLSYFYIRIQNGRYAGQICELFITFDYFAIELIEYALARTLIGLLPFSFDGRPVVGLSELCFGVYWRRMMVDRLVRFQIDEDVV